MKLPDIERNAFAHLSAHRGQFPRIILSVYAGLARTRIRSARFCADNLKGDCLPVFWSNADTVLTQTDGIEDGETENPHEWRGSCGLRSWRYAD
jgi:hypothetical protein